MIAWLRWVGWTPCRGMGMGAIGGGGGGGWLDLGGHLAGLGGANASGGGSGRLAGLAEVMKCEGRREGGCLLLCLMAAPACYCTCDSWQPLPAIAPVTNGSHCLLLPSRSPTANLPWRPCRPCS